MINKNFDLTLWCPTCKERHAIGFNAKIETCLYNSTGDFRASDLKDICIEFEADSFNISSFCNKCRNKFIVIDTGVADCIELLNNNQRYTAYSCQGHIEYHEDKPAIYSMPYITFSELYNDFASPTFRKGLPKNWEIIEDVRSIPIRPHQYIPKEVTEFCYTAYDECYQLPDEEIKRIIANAPMNELYAYLAEYFKK